MMYTENTSTLVSYPTNVYQLVFSRIDKVYWLKVKVLAKLYKNIGVHLLSS